MKKILFATENESKVERFKKGLLENDIEIISIKDIGKKINSQVCLLDVLMEKDFLMKRC